LKLENVQKIAKKPPKTSWVFFKELKNVLKIDEKPPKTSWVFFDIENYAKNFKTTLLNHPGSSLQN
jgi:hypothetical protein